jgi:uncharacterized protein YvpB
MKKTPLIILAILVIGYVVVRAYFDTQKPDASLDQWLADNQVNQKNIDTEGTNLPEIIVDNNQEIPEPEAKEQEKEEIDTENEEIISDLEDIENDDSREVVAENLPEEINLAIPFFAQAPEGDRSLPWKEACEEASLALAAYYLNGKKLTLAQFKEDVMGMVTLENELFGDYIDTSVEQTAEVFEKFYGIGTTKIIDNPTIEQIKAELVQGHPIVAPFAGKKLGNSNFTNGWPRYHMLVIRGYDDTYFYTNDVGTKQGENFPYTYATIMDALHDLVREGEWDITEGAKRILVLSL